MRTLEGEFIWKYNEKGSFVRSEFDIFKQAPPPFTTDVLLEKSDRPELSWARVLLPFWQICRFWPKVDLKRVSTKDGAPLFDIIKDRKNRDFEILIHTLKKRITSCLQGSVSANQHLLSRAVTAIGVGDG